MLSRVAQNITPSATCELEGTVADLQAAGIDIIALNAGEPDFMTPEEIQKACRDALSAGKTKYVNITGIAELRREICKKLERDNGLRYTPEQICVSTGAKQALNNALMAVMDPGREVIIPIPGWVSYIEIVKLYGGIPVCVRTTENYQLDIDAVAAAVTENTAAIIINSPNNPTGAVYSKSSLEKLAELAIRHNFYIISDEVYEKLVYGNAVHESAASVSPEAYAHTIVINGMSKAFSMTGWRIGYTAAPKEIAAGIQAIQGHTTSNSTTFVQWAAAEALRRCDKDIARMNAEFEKRKNYTYDRLIHMDGVQCRNVDGAFYLLPDISFYYGKKSADITIKNSFDFCEFILKAAHVAVVPGAAFNAKNCVRIAYTNSMSNIAKGLDRIEAALKTLQ